MSVPCQFNEMNMTFKDFPSSYKDNSVNEVMKMINRVSQDNPVEFFQHFLKSSMGKALVSPNVLEEKVNSLMKTILGHYLSEIHFHKPILLSMVASHFDFEELKRFGFPITKAQHEKALAKDKEINENKENRENSSLTKNLVKIPPPKHKKPDSTLVKLIQFCMSYSVKSRLKNLHPPSLGHLDIPGFDPKCNYDLTDKKSTIFAAFNEAYPELKVSSTSFNRYLPKNFIDLRSTLNTFPQKMDILYPISSGTKPKEAVSTFNSSGANLANNIAIPPPPSKRKCPDSATDSVVSPPQLNPNSTSDRVAPSPSFNSVHSNSTNNTAITTSTKNLNHPESNHRYNHSS